MTGKVRTCLAIIAGTDLGTTGQHLLASVQPRSAGLLNLLDLATPLSDPAARKSRSKPDQIVSIDPNQTDPSIELGTHTLPILLFGIINLIVTGRLPGILGSPKFSSLIRLTISPKACQSRITRQVERVSSVQAVRKGVMKAEEQEQGGTDLGNRVQSTLNAEDSLGVSRDGFGDVDAGVGLALSQIRRYAG